MIVHKYPFSMFFPTLEIVLSIFLVGCSHNQCRENGDLIFDSECVMISLASGEMTVEGLYFFLNTSLIEKSVSIYYPFFIDNDHPYPEWIDVEGFNFVKEKEGISWWMSLPACSERVLRVRYRQKLHVNTAVYILTSTQKWGKPLREAEFIIRAPLAWGELSFSYVPYRRAVKETEGVVYYYIREKNFIPDKELIISWR